MSRTTSRAMAEEATGCVQPSNSLGTFYIHGGEPVSADEAAKLITVQEIEVPNAGAGSYHEFFEALGYVEVETLETCSSAGDWTLAVKDKEGYWFVAYQANRYPYHGFRYAVSPAGWCTLEEAINFAFNED